MSLFDFENRNAIFPDVHRSYKFCLLTVAGQGRPVEDGATLIFFAVSLADLAHEQKRFTLSAKDIAQLNPNTLTCATFRSRHDAILNLAIYRRVPVFLNEEKPQENAYSPQVWRLLNTTDDSSDFVAPSDHCDDELVPVIEAKTIHQFDHRFATFTEGESTDAIDVLASAKVFPEFDSRARYYITDQLFRERMPDQLRDKRWFLTARNIARSTDERTVIAAIIPRGRQL